MHRRQGSGPWLACVATLLCGASVARAQEVALSPEQAQQSAKHPRGSYAGVTPGGAAGPGIAARPGTSLEITWPGFQMQPDGGSRVFVQTTVAIDPVPVVSGNKVMLDFGKARVAGANRYPLYTQFFNTPVTRVEIRRTRRQTLLEITLRAQVQPRVSSERAPSGYYFVYIDFPRGDYLPKGAPQPQAAAPAPPSLDDQAPPAPSPITPSAGTPVKMSPRAKAKLDTSMDNELPPGVHPKGKAGTSSSGSVKLGQ